MYIDHWGMAVDPFASEAGSWCFESSDARLAMSKVKHSVMTRGICLLSGEPGTGKTMAARQCLSKLGKSEFKVCYTAFPMLRSTEFLKMLAQSLGLKAAGRKAALFQQIRSCIAGMAESNVTPVLCLDECQRLDSQSLLDLMAVTSFEMDSKKLASIVMISDSSFSEILGMRIHESFRQRITSNYKFQGLARSECAAYLEDGMRSAGGREGVFLPEAIEALHNASMGRVRTFNSLVSRCLIVGSQRKLANVTKAEVAEASDDYELG
ncbi:MAG: AAA family ATPase [Clostridiales bacterium]|nr:AAA family ATPase [Clostridiales bacterium]